MPIQKGISLPILFVCFFVCYLACAWSVYAYFESTQSPEHQSSVGANPKNSIVNEEKTIPWKEYQEALKTEREELQKQAKDNFDRMEKMQDRVFYGIVILGGILLGVIGFLFGQTRRDVKAQLTEEISKSVRSQIEQDVLNTAKAQIEEQIKRLDGMNQEMTDIQSKYHKLDAEMKEMQSYKDRLILWFFSGGVNTAEREITALKNAGFNNVKPQDVKAGEPFELGNPDLVIFSYEKGEDEKGKEARRRMEIIAGLLKKNAPDVWLLIHTKSNTDIGDDEKRILGDLWYFPTNFPATLVTNAQALIRKQSKF